MDLELKELSTELEVLPKKYDVVMHNDEVTTMGFVVAVLKIFFHHETKKANSLMLCIHEQGSAVVGTYSYDIANTKVTQVHASAQKEGYPLICSVEISGES